MHNDKPRPSFLRARRTAERVLGVLMLVFALLGPATVHAGRDCVAREPDATTLKRGLDLAVRTAKRLDATGQQVVAIARVGQDLSRYGLQYSHLGLAYRENASSDAGARTVGRWRVVHKLNQCGSDRASVHRQGLAEFFNDDPHELRAGIMLLEPDVQASLNPVLRDNRRAVRMHVPHYSMVAYAWGTHYQQSNQWAIETLAQALEPGIEDRHAAQSWLRIKGYEPTELGIGALERLGGRITSANIEFDDHPNSLRFAGRIRTVTADSVFEWLDVSGLGTELIVVR